MMGITYGDHLIDSGYYDITPEQELDMSDHEEIEDCDDCESCKGTGRISWFDHAEGAWRDEHCTDCDGKGVKFITKPEQERELESSEMAKLPQVILAHLGWLARYADGTTQANCSDMALRSSRQVDELEEALADEFSKLERERDALREALKQIATECSTFPIKDGLAFRCESIARAALEAKP